MYGVNSSSDAISRDMNSILYSTTFKHPAGGEFAKIKQLISLDPYPNYDDQNQNQNQNRSQHQQDESRGENQSSFFSNLLTDNGGDEFPDPVAGSSNHEPEERLFMRNQRQEQKEAESDVREFLRYKPSSVDAKHERKVPASQNQDLPTTAAMNGSRRVPNLPPVNDSGSYGFANRSDLDSMSSNLVRQNSTPAGFLWSLTDGNGFASMKKGGSSNALSNHISFSLGSSSSSTFLPQIAENENELQESTFNSMKRDRDGVLRTSQNGENGSNTPTLVHHMSLPKTSSEMATVDNFLHFQQESTVPWKTRAKRGFATHPRSIAERERRTRISERIKRLQELFPDIDKQTNTADMLDMAVEYIKNLQKELQLDLVWLSGLIGCSFPRLGSKPQHIENR
ncbi:hypothetical protein E3N88_19187 [Mikania micrantha]|uniref:BHLH domain-containing protein n=1 Tax=Mikania micrantha TaxID=192012 RepID=A0A5N6NMH6_9ASTR|nr:hypothetical protein E3N88_19187 [Mikania micrantha]